MLPLTQNKPKPLLPTGKETLIDRHLRRLAAAGIREVIINVHYLAEQIQHHIGTGEQLGVQVYYSVESQLLETAGGIKQALPLLDDEPFIVVSSDIYTDYDFTQLKRVDLGNKFAHLVMVANPPQHPKGDYGLTSKGTLHHLPPKYTYAGIGVFSPQPFKLIPPGPEKLRTYFDLWATSGAMSAELCNGYWLDVGTPTRYQMLLSELQKDPADNEKQSIKQQY